MVVGDHRDPATQHFQPLFEYDHLPERLQEISRPVHDLAEYMIRHLADGPELTEGLRKLWEAKNSFVVHAGFCQEQGL